MQICSQDIQTMLKKASDIQNSEDIEDQTVITYIRSMSLIPINLTKQHLEVVNYLQMIQLKNVTVQISVKLVLI